MKHGWTRKRNKKDAVYKIIVIAKKCKKANKNNPLTPFDKGE
jgi:hypothetical protein